MPTAEDGPSPASLPPLVSIVIVAYGTGPILADAVDAVARHTSIPHEVIVVDNPTDDDRPTAADVLGGRDDVTIIRPEQNLGFGGGNQLGVSHANGTYVCFLNPDVIVTAGWLEPLVAALGDPIVGIAAPVLLNTDGSLQEAGQLVYSDGCTAAIGGPEVLTGDLRQVFARDVDYASGACWLVRRSEYLELGGFDRRYHPAYFEDVDYAVRVERAGQRTRLVPCVPVVHHHGQGGGSSPLAIAEASRETFRTLWADELANRPTRPRTDQESIVARDRLAAATTVFVVRSATTRLAQREAALEDAMAVAQEHPRGRVTYIIDDATDLDTDGARQRGVEVLIGDLDQLVAERASDATALHRIGRRRTLPPVLRSLWSPWTALVGVVGIVLRILVLRSPSGELNSDEAYTGLQAMGVLDGRFPVVVDGNRYTAVLEAYLFAPIVGLAGPSIVLLKLVPVFFWAITAVLTYVAGSYLIERRVGAVAASFVWIAPGALLVVSTLAYVGYALGMAVCVATLYTSAKLIDRDRPRIRGAAVVGACAGLGAYIHPMYLAVLVPIVLPVAWVHRRHVRSFWIPLVAAGVAVNLPFLAWNAVNGWPSLETQNGLPGTYTDRIRTFAEELVPRGYGIRDVQFNWVFGRGLGLFAYAALIGAVIVGCVVLVRSGERRSRFLLPATVVVVWPLMALFSPLIWSADGRYNVISFPFVSLAAASAIAAIPWRGRAAAGVAVAAVAVWAAVYVWPHTDRSVLTSTVDPNEPLSELVQFLDEHGIDRVAGSYWRVLTLEYASDRRIEGAVSPPEAVRFPERQRTVESSDPSDVAFVFPNWAENPAALWMPADQYDRFDVGNSVVYVPTADAG